MTLPRKILLAVGAVLLVVVAALAWLLATFDANRYKGLAIDWMREHRQRTLAIGEMKLAVFPRLQVDLHEVSLSERQQPGERFASLASARLALQWWPLLRQQLVVDEVQAQGLSLRYTRDEQGRSNIDDLLRPAETQAAAPATGKPLQFDIRGITLEGLQLQIDDRLAHLRGQATLASLQTGRLNPQAMTPVSLVADVQLSEPRVAAQVRGSLQLQVDPGDGQARGLKVRTRDVALKVQGELPGLSALDAALSGTIGYDAGSTGPGPAGQGAVEAEALALTLSLRAGPLQLQDSKVTLQRFEFRPAGQHLLLEQLALQARGALTGKGKGEPAQPLNLALNWPQLTVQGQALKGAALSGSFSLQGPAALQGRLSSGAPSGSFEAIHLPALQLVLGAATQGAGASRVKGRVQADLTLHPQRREVTARALTIDASVHNPALQPLTLSARGQLAASPQAARWQLGGAMNAQAFDTDGQLTLGGPVPRLQAQARFGELDLDALLPPRPRTPAPAASASTPRAAPPAAAAPDEPIDLSGLRALNAEVRLQAGLLRYQPYVLRELTATAALEDGRLQIAPLRLRAWDGRLDATLTASAGASPAQQRLTLQANAQEILVQALLKDLAQNDLLEGRGRLSLDLSTGGASLAALKQALSGQAALQLRDGALQGINLAARLREVKAALSLKQDAVEQARRSEKTDFSELAASFQIHNGVAENRDLSLKSPFLRLAGEGRIDLPAQRLDYTTRATLAGTSKGQDGAEAAMLKGLTVPVRLSGALDSPGWRIVWSEVALGAAGNTLRQAGEKLQDRAEDRLKARAAEKLGLKASDAASAPLKEQVKDLAKDRAREAVKDRFKDLLGR